MRSIARQRRGEMRKKDGQTARHIAVFCFLSSASAFCFSVKPRISKRKASSEACHRWSELPAKPASNVDLSLRLSSVSPLRDRLARKFSAAIVTASALQYLSKSMFDEHE